MNQNAKEHEMNKIGAAFTAIALAKASSASFANDLPGNSTYHPPENFKIVYVSRLNEIQQGEALRFATAARTHQAQAEIASDKALAAELQAHHVELKNVIASRPTMSGSTIYYVK
jgi:hypothetical protein